MTRRRLLLPLIVVGSAVSAAAVFWRPWEKRPDTGQPAPPAPEPGGPVVLRGHTMTVHALAWSPVGTALASGGYDSTVRLWDSVTGKQTAVLPLSEGKWTGSLAWRPDGRSIAAVSAVGSRTIRVWDVATGGVAADLDYTASRYSARAAVVWGPDGKTLLATDGWTAQSWDPAAGAKGADFQCQDRVDGSLPAPGSETATAWSRDGKFVAVGFGDGSIRVWEPAARRETAVLRGHTKAVSTLAWHPAGTALVSTGPDKTVRLWDPAAGKEKAVLTTDGPFGLDGQLAAWSPDGTRLAVAASFSVLILDPATGRKTAELGGGMLDYYGFVTAVAWRPDGTAVAAAYEDSSEHGIRIWAVPPAN